MEQKEAIGGFRRSDVGPPAIHNIKMRDESRGRGRAPDEREDEMCCPGYTDAEGGPVGFRQGSTASEPRPQTACSVSSNDPFILSGPNRSGAKVPLISEWPLQDERQLEHLLATFSKLSASGAWTKQRHKYRTLGSATLFSVIYNIWSKEHKNIPRRSETTAQLAKISSWGD